MKYRNHKTTVNGLTFDSKKEADRYLALVGKAQRGEIYDLQRQVKFALLPSQKGRYRTERKVEYIADFVYRYANGETVVEDVKGIKTKDYILKRKMMLHVHGISIKEV